MTVLSASPLLLLSTRQRLYAINMMCRRTRPSRPMIARTNNLRLRCFPVKGNLEPY